MKNVRLFFLPFPCTAVATATGNDQVASAAKKKLICNLKETVFRVRF